VRHFPFRCRRQFLFVQHRPRLLKRRPMSISSITRLTRIQIQTQTQIQTLPAG
jgi:hypothetical protein